jgi:methionyl-tRNA formyltransferase
VTGLRIVFMGTPEFACPTLQKLIDRGENVVAAVTQPDRPKGRGQQTVAPPVKVLAEKHGIPVLQPVKVRLPEAVEEIRALRPDLIIVVAFGQILPKSLLEIPPHGCINVHASLLPRWRGAAPLNWCIIAGDAETGVTTMQMDVGLDTGDMLLKKSTPIGQDEDASSLHDRLCGIGAEALAETIDLLVAGRLVPEKQDDAHTTYASMLKKEDGLIDWSGDAVAIRNRIRGLTPWPGAYSYLNGKTLKIFKTRTGTGAGSPGTVLQTGKGGIEVACGSGSLWIDELQLEGKKRLAAAEFLAGCRIETGTTLGDKDAPL